MLTVKSLKVGDHFDNYILEKSFDPGGMGVVWLAHHVDSGKHVAIKFMQKPDKDLERFKREATALAKLSDNIHIIKILSFDDQDGLYYFVMQYASRGDLTSKISKGMVLETAINYLEQIAEGLDFAHQNGIIHRDLKPANILFDEKETLLLADFGLAHDDDAPTLTHTGWGMGTPLYMAPEQIVDAKHVETSADIYSLGIIAFELFTQRLPFRGGFEAEIQLQHLHSPVPQITLFNPTLPPTLQKVLETALDKTPKNRYLSAGRFVAALKEAIYTWQAEQRIEQLNQKIVSLQKELDITKKTSDRLEFEKINLLEANEREAKRHREVEKKSNASMIGLAGRLSKTVAELNESKLRLKVTLSSSVLVSLIYTIFPLEQIGDRLYIIFVIWLLLALAYFKVTRDKLRSTFVSLRKLIQEEVATYRNRNS